MVSQQNEPIVCPRGEGSLPSPKHNRGIRSREGWQRWQPSVRVSLVAKSKNETIDVFERKLTLFLTSLAQFKTEPRAIAVVLSLRQILFGEHPLVNYNWYRLSTEIRFSHRDRTPI